MCSPMMLIPIRHAPTVPCCPGRLFMSMGPAASGATLAAGLDAAGVGVLSASMPGSMSASTVLAGLGASGMTSNALTFGRVGLKYARGGECRRGNACRSCTGRSCQGACLAGKQAQGDSKMCGCLARGGALPLLRSFKAGDSMHGSQIPNTPRASAPTNTTPYAQPTCSCLTHYIGACTAHIHRVQRPGRQHAAGRAFCVCGRGHARAGGAQHPVHHHGGHG